MNKTHKTPNPQGKGLVPVLQSLNESRTRVPAVAKSVIQVSSELFTSLFVLHSQFHFKPVIGKPYWLYLKSGLFKLSLVSPFEGGKSFGSFIGECQMHQDITWSLELSEEAEKEKALMDFINAKKNEFEENLKSLSTLEKALPFYHDKLPFYQRVYASALANSLKSSMSLSGITRLNYSQACKLLK